MGIIKSIVKRQHYERKAMPKYYHDKLCLFGVWIPEANINKINKSISKYISTVLNLNKGDKSI